eukprot:CAMPEP_0198526276 /NCGR_PEP_ID=MMETSP1462-20131121/23867_1 /TAXON_ID=1333877 /ORGANISM="Brandtodinium nutriculum, Strain RCC3387" /LENGTH=453 /DNA_ID=CAMNT_0044256051 /DNA_START=97 /DNA_END=1459 /DNA_ORIENTATION=-
MRDNSRDDQLVAQQQVLRASTHGRADVLAISPSPARRRCLSWGMPTCNVLAAAEGNNVLAAAEDNNVLALFVCAHSRRGGQRRQWQRIGRMGAREGEFQASAHLAELGRDQRREILRRQQAGKLHREVRRVQPWGRELQGGDHGVHFGDRSSVPRLEQRRHRGGTFRRLQQGLREVRPAGATVLPAQRQGLPRFCPQRGAAPADILQHGGDSAGPRRICAIVVVVVEVVHEVVLKFLSWHLALDVFGLGPRRQIAHRDAFELQVRLQLRHVARKTHDVVQRSVPAQQDASFIRVDEEADLNADRNVVNEGRALDHPRLAGLALPRQGAVAQNAINGSAQLGGSRESADSAARVGVALAAPQGTSSTARSSLMSVSNPDMVLASECSHWSTSFISFAATLKSPDAPLAERVGSPASHKAPPLGRLNATPARGAGAVPRRGIKPSSNAHNTDISI